MSDLTGKFTSIEGQLSAQHIELMEALNTIAFALGAPPTIPTTNLEDIYTQLSALISGTALIYSANNTFFAAMLETVGLINANTDTIINNNSLNAQRLIAALYATFCACETDVPLIAPPLDVTPTEVVDDAKCRRIQFYLSVFGNWLNQIANYGASGAAITGGTLATLLSVVAADAGIVAVGAEVGAAGGPPGIVIGAVVGLITVAVYTLGGSILIDYANQFNDPTLRDNMVQAMYAATNADEGYTAFKSTLLAGMATIPAEIIYTLWWSAWSNDVYSGVPEVDDSAFDGSICGPPAETCTWITTGNRADINIYFPQAYAWDDSASGVRCEVTIGLLSGAVDCKMIVNGTMVVDWTPAPQFFAYEGPGSFQILLSGNGHVSELFRVCQTGL